MSAAPAFPFVLATAQAVAESALPAARGRTIQGYAFYRRHTVALLRRYLRISMEVGRAPCILGNVVFRGRVSSYRMTTFEDLMIFIFDVEKCLKQLDHASQTVIAHMALEDYTILETAMITRDSERSVSRIYNQALDRLTRQFLDSGLLDPEQGQQKAVLGREPQGQFSAAADVHDEPADGRIGSTGTGYQ
ncbi:MAG TPA: hypothetical protein VME68_12450 [Acidobacteriaceae bacterium]|nr:hypothetical protein [Acidobacteriaceae bacterium]